MGYDLVVVDAKGSGRLDYTELLPQELAALVEQATVLNLPLLALLPPYWGGEERQLSVRDLRALDRELARIEKLAQRGPDLDSAAKKLRRVVDVAVRNARPLEIVPD